MGKELKRQDLEKFEAHRVKLLDNLNAMMLILQETPFFDKANNSWHRSVLTSISHVNFPTTEMTMSDTYKEIDTMLNEK